jgi:uncharacterized membrane protein
MTVTKSKNSSIGEIRTRLAERISYRATETDAEIYALLRMLDDKYFPAAKLDDLRKLVATVKWADFQRSLSSTSNKIRTFIEAERKAENNKINLEIMALDSVWKRYEAMSTPALEELSSHRIDLDSYEAEVICKILRRRLGIVPSRDT